MKKNFIDIALPHAGNPHKVFLAMRLTGFFLLVACLQVSAHVGAQTITYSGRNVALMKVFKEIRKQTGYEFLYNSTVLKKDAKIDLKFDHTPLRAVLDDISEKGGFVCDIVGKTIVIWKKAEKTPVESPEITLASIHGAVVDSATGKPLAGVTVMVRGSTIGTTTNANGEFSLDVPDGAVLQVSYLGYTSKVVNVGGRTNIKIQLSAASTGLNQLIVVGYGTQKKVNLTGAVTQISGKALENRPVSNTSKALQGLIPNLNITFGSGKPGQEGTINIRGNTSINGGSPLVLIDGVPGDLDRVNPNDIASVTVLKDAAASAIYGARATFGVILVTTKKATPGETTITYGLNFGWSTQTQSTKFITDGYDEDSLWDASMLSSLGITVTGNTAEDNAELLARRNDKTPNPDRPWVVVKNINGADQYRYYGNFNWWDYFYRKNLPMVEHSLSISTSGKKLNYLFSGEYRLNDGILKVVDDKNRAYTFRSKVDGDLFPWLSIENNTSFYSSQYTGGRSSTFGWGTQLDEFASPSYLPFNPDGTYTYLPGSGPYTIANGNGGDMLYGKSKSKENQYDLRNTLNATVKIGSHVNFVANYTYEMILARDISRIVEVPYSLHPGVVQIMSRFNVDQLSESDNTSFYQVFNAYGTYQNSFGKNDLKATVGYNAEEMKLKQLGASVNNILSLDQNDLALGTGNKDVIGGASSWALLGAFYRINYAFSSKYLVELDGRYDGTSRFKQGSRFGFFPSVSAGWRVSEEPFFKPLKNILNDFKLRASYGSLGNQQVGTYAYIPIMNATTMNYVMDGQLTTYVGQPAAISPTLTWERTETVNGGIDGELLNGRLTFSFDKYVRRTIGMLTAGRTLPAVFGASSPLENAANLKTRGFELSVGWHNSDLHLLGKPFSYHVNVVLSDYKAWITKFNNPSRILSNYYVGERLGEIWGYVIDGMFKTDEEAKAYPVNQDFVNPRRVQAPVGLRDLMAGDLKVRDLDGNDTINLGQNTVDHPGDRKVIGNSQPRFPFGISFSADWGGFDLSVFLQGIGKQDWYPGNDGISYNEAVNFFSIYARPYSSFIPANFKSLMWSPDNPNAYLPRLRGYSAQNGILNMANNRYLQNLSYIRLRNIQVGYSLPAGLLERIYVKNLRFYFSGDNLMTLTKLHSKYIDPEQVASENGSNAGNIYPFSSKQFTFGVNLTY